MFDNIGRTIQGLAKTVFIISVIIIGLGVFIAAASGSEDAALIMIFFGMPIGIFVAWLSVLHLYAYGKITECCEELCWIGRELLDAQYMQGGNSGRAKLTREAQPEAETVVAPKVQPEPETAIMPKIQPEPETVIMSEVQLQTQKCCAQCGTILEDGDIFCPECGTPRQK